MNADGRSVEPQNGASSVEDVLSALTVDQEHMILYAISQAYIAT